ncbi:MAG: hypothetical protein JW822_04000 [Spirochaetales bacterium]|nr:hypothetical protein [Spirochaetales bacterium]
MKNKYCRIILFLCVIISYGCPINGAPHIEYPEFVNETQVIINGYDLDAMEPFITKDGSILFFNSLNDEVDTSLYYATMADATHFNSQGKISGVNGTPSHLDAVASMDTSNTFYFISTRNYPAVFENLQSGTFNNGTVPLVQPVTGDFYIYSPNWIIMDAEISGDGNHLYYVNARYDGQQWPEEAMLGIAEKQALVFIKSTLSAEIFKNVNNPAYLVYAPCVSADGKEVYFTRSKKGTGITQICVAVRSDTTASFSRPKVITISGEKVEAPSLTADGSRLYYHKRITINAEEEYHIYTMERK